MEPVTLSVAAVGATVVTEGIKFLYAQAAELLKRWRERKDDQSASELEPVDVSLPADVFAGQLVDPKIHYKTLATAQAEINDLRKDLLDYAEGEPVGDDPDVLQKVDALRRLIEAVYQQRLTFKGEDRPISGPIVEGTIDVKNVLGYAAAVRVKTMKSGRLLANVRADYVGPGGELLGVDVETMGTDDSR